MNGSCATRLETGTQAKEGGPLVLEPPNCGYDCNNPFDVFSNEDWNFDSSNNVTLSDLVFSIKRNMYAGFLEFRCIEVDMKYVE